MTEPTDLELAFAVLKDTGASDEEAAAVLQYDPSVTGRLQLPIARKRAELAQQAVEDAKAEYAASPAGRVEAAKAALKASQERAEVLAGAKVMLAEQGYPADDMTEAELLHHAGIERDVSLLSRAELDAEHEALAARWRTLSPLEQAQQAQALGIESASVERYVRGFIEDGNGDEGDED